MQLWIIGIICLAVVQILAPAVEANPVDYAFGSDAGSISGFRQNGQQPKAKFGERVKDWFKRLKNRILGRKNEQSSTPTPEEATKEMMLELEKEDLQFAQRHPGRFYLDLSKVRFDPKKDWGFRLGKWYFIRKVSVDSIESNDWKPSETTEAEWPEGTYSNSDDRFSSAETLATAASDNASPEVTTSQESTMGSRTPTIPTTRSNEVTWKVATTELATTNDETSKVATQEETTTNVPPTYATTKIPESKDSVTPSRRRDHSAEVIGPTD